MFKLFTLAIDFNLPIQQLCIESLRKYNANAFVFESFEQIATLPGGTKFINDYRHLSTVHFSDMFRVWYILNFGGTWIDADCIHMRQFDFPYELNESGVAFIYDDHKQDRINQCLIHCNNTNNKFLTAMYSRMERLCYDKGASGLAYLDLGQWSINHIIAHHNINPTVVPHWEYSYLAWYSKHRFMEEREWNQFQYDRGTYSPNSYCYHLTNAVIDFNKTKSYSELLNSKTFVSFLLQRALTNGWETNRHCAILNRLHSHSSNYRYAEVGTYKGETLSVIGQQRNNATLYAIDPWKNVSSEDYKNTNDYIAFEDNAKQEENYQAFKNNCWFLESQGRLKVNRNTSVVASTQYPDEYFDMVFIDADHSYSGVKQDVEVWYPKVKKGGFVGGHDYDYPGYNFGVKQAVDEFVLKHSLKLELDCDYTWFIKK